MKIKFVIFIFLGTVLLWLIYSAFQPYTVKFSKDFYYDYESGSIFGKDDLVDITPKIIDYSYDKKFVVVKQNPKYSYDFMYNYPEEFNDKSYKNGLNEIYYWIISLKEKMVFGPMLPEEFNSMCEEKNIRLKFKK